MGLLRGLGAKQKAHVKAVRAIGTAMGKTLALPHPAATATVPS